MSAQGFSGLRATRPGPRWALVVGCAVLGAAAVAAMVRDAGERRGWDSITRRYDGARRFPAALDTANVIDENGEAGIVIAEALVGAPAGAGASAREVVFGVIENRPGSAHARLLLGRSAPLSGPAAGWVGPLELATVAAPGLDLVWTELGSRYLATWDSLSPEDRTKAEAALRRAFASPDFLRAALPTSIEALGPERAIRTLPDDPATLRQAARILQELGSAPGSARAANLVGARLKNLAPPAAVNPGS